ncbi:hypothetical protein Tco_1446686 [Tanacetum coccineum]
MRMISSLGLQRSLGDKYVAEILKKFDFASVKTASTPIETQKPLVKDEEASDVDVHLYRSMIGSLMYVTASRPDIMFAVCACSRFQVTPKTSHLSAVKRIFRYLKGKPKLGLWYPRESSFDLESYSDSDYAGANLDRKSTTGGCQFLGRRLITWQCKKQTIVATSTTEAEYVAAASCCGQVLWIQNQMLDYGFNFMNTKIYIDNESTICIVKNPVYHSKTKHIAIRHHFIRDAYEKKLIQVLKIHTNDNVADLLTKAFDSKNSLVKHFEDMRLCRPSKEYLLVWFNPPRDVSMSCLTTKGMHTIGAVCTRSTQANSLSRSLIARRADLIFDDADGIDSLPNQAIFDTIQRMGYEGDLTVLTFNKAFEDIKKKKMTPFPSLHPRHSPNHSPTPIVLFKSQNQLKRIPKKSSSKKQRMHKKDCISKQGREDCKKEKYSVQRNPCLMYMPVITLITGKRHFAQSEWRDMRIWWMKTRRLIKDRLSTEDELNDSEEIFEVLDEKGPRYERKFEVLWAIEDIGYDCTDHLLTLKPLPKIDLKDKGRRRLNEEDESEVKMIDIPQAVKKLQTVEVYEVMAMENSEEWEAEEDREK